MSPEKEQKLFSTFPFLYRSRFESDETALKLWGFECDDGWFELIWALSEKIEGIARSEGLIQTSNIWPNAKQVKEKFGSLRFRVFNVSNEIDALIGQAQNDSLTICEICGASITPSSITNLKTLCSEHVEVPGGAITT